MNQGNQLLEKVKEQYAKEMGWHFHHYSKEVDEVSERYAKEFAKAELEKVSTELRKSRLKTGNPKMVSREEWFKTGMEIAEDLINKRIEEI